ncbi:MAG TPA: DUF3445 domain-containing protein [Acetobacteraceae bacterium]
MAMGLVTVPDSAWFEIDRCYPVEMAERRRLLRERRAEVFAALPASDAARKETLAAVTDNLCRHHPAWFTQDSTTLRNRLTNEAWRLDEPSLDPLVLAGLLVQEDLCLIQNMAEGPVFSAGILCFPSRWRLDEKIGRPLLAVHGSVPFYAERLGGAVDRFMRNVKPGYTACRLNWSVLDDPALFQPTGKWRTGINPDITADNAGERLHLRVERQTLRRLPESGAMLFGIRVHSYPLVMAVGTPTVAASLAAAVSALPLEMSHYKSISPFRAALLRWLEARAHAG